MKNIKTKIKCDWCGKELLITKERWYRHRDKNLKHWFCDNNRCYRLFRFGRIKIYTEKVWARVIKLFKKGFIAVEISKMKGMPRAEMLYKETRKRGYNFSRKEITKIRLQREAQKLKGKIVVLTNGTKAQYTGKINLYTPPRCGNPKWILELKCPQGHVILRSSNTATPHCHICFPPRDPLNKYLYERARYFGQTLQEVQLKRKNQTNEDGLVCCAICGLAESVCTRKLCQDHDHRMGPAKSGMGNRDLVCWGCNVFFIPRAERLVLGESILIHQADSLGWKILINAIKYVEKWDAKFKKPRI